MKQFLIFGEIQLTKVTTAIVAGNAAAAIASIFGGWSKEMNLLTILMIVDFFMGVLIAMFWKRSNKSETGGISSLSMWQGLCRKGVTLAIVLIAAQTEQVTGTGFIRDAVVYAYCFNEFVSICEHAKTIGVPVPEAIVNALNTLKNKKGK